MTTILWKFPPVVHRDVINDRYIKLFLHTLVNGVRILCFQNTYDTETTNIFNAIPTKLFKNFISKFFFCQANNINLYFSVIEMCLLKHIRSFTWKICYMHYRKCSITYWFLKNCKKELTLQINVGKTIHSVWNYICT